MIIGVAREIKSHEYRVAMTPHGVRELTGDGHRVLVEPGAGDGSGFSDDSFRQAGAEIVDRHRLFGAAELLIKVKEPLPSEYSLLREGQIIFTYLHLAPNRPLTEQLLEKRVTAFAYETLERNGSTPLLTPMSEVAGRMAPLVGAYYLQRPHGGSGLLPSGVPGVLPARALILGAGIVGKSAARVASGIGMDTVVLNRGHERLREIDQEFGGKVRTRILDTGSLQEEITVADIIVGALYSTGGRTPILIDRALLAQARNGSVIVDVAIDQGGCAVTSRPTTHDDPVFTEHSVIHYCVANMPSAYPRTSTLALTNATFPYIRQLAGSGIDAAVNRSPELASALNIHKGAVIHKGLAASLDWYQAS